MSNEKDMQKTGWKNIDLPPQLEKARREQERGTTGMFEAEFESVLWN